MTVTLEITVKLSSRPMLTFENTPTGTAHATLVYRDRRRFVVPSTMPLSSAYWSNGGGARTAPNGSYAASHLPGASPQILPAIPSSEDAVASLSEIQAALLQPGGGVIQQTRTPLVDAGRQYKLGYERQMRHNKVTSTTRLTRIQEVREQEKLWARFQAREFRAAVHDHHDELTHQLHQGWLAARKEKQQQLERDYSGAVVGVGKAQREAAAMSNATAKKQKQKEQAHKRFDADLSALERHKTALGREFEMLDSVDKPYFVAKERQVKAIQLADKTRSEMREKAAAFADSEEGRRRKLVKALTQETNQRVARPLRAGLHKQTFKSTHFNDLVLDQRTGVAVGVRSVRKNGSGRGDKDQFDFVPAAAATQKLGGDAGIEINIYAKKSGKTEYNEGNTSTTPSSAFSAAFEQEKQRAERRDSEIKQLKAKKAKEASRANFAAQRQRAVNSKREMAVKFDLEARAERAQKVKEMAKGGGLINAPLLRKWNAEKKTTDTLRAFETAFSEISKAGEGGSGSNNSRNGGGSGSGDHSSSRKATFDDEAPFDEAENTGAGFGDLFDENAEEQRLDNLGLENVLAMALGAKTPVEDSTARRVPTRTREGAPELLARRGVVGSTMDEIAAVVAAGERAVPSPRRPYDTRVYEDDSDDDFVGAAGGAGMPVSEVLDEQKLDRAVAAAAEHGRRAALAAVSPDTVGAASAAAQLSDMARSLDNTANSQTFSKSSLNLSEDTSHMFSNTMDDSGLQTEVTVPFGSEITKGSSSSGDAEAEMRASLAATAAAMDRVTREAEEAEKKLEAASRRASVRPQSAFEDTGSASPLPNRVDVPELKPLDAILSALGEQVRSLDAAAAGASAPPPSSKYTSSSSGDNASLDDSALYAAAAAAANNSAPPSSQTFGDVSTHLPSTPGLDSMASPSGVPGQTPQSENAPAYGLKPQRDVHLGYGTLDVAAVAARIAAAAVADAAPGEAPDATARRVASAMEAALGGAFTTSKKNVRNSPGVLWDEHDTNPDSSWAQALGQLEGEWAQSLNLSKAPDSEVKQNRNQSFQQSPSRFVGVASEDPDDFFREAELLANAAAEAEESQLDLESHETKYSYKNTRTLAAPLRVSERDDDDSWSYVGTVGSSKAPTVVKNNTFSVDGRSLVDLANALDQKSFDDGEGFDDEGSFDEQTNDSFTAFEERFGADNSLNNSGITQEVVESSTAQPSPPQRTEKNTAAVLARKTQAKALRAKAAEADRKHREALKFKTTKEKKTKKTSTGKQSGKKTKPTAVFR